MRSATAAALAALLIAGCNGDDTTAANADSTLTDKASSAVEQAASATEEAFNAAEETANEAAEAVSSELSDTTDELTIEQKISYIYGFSTVTQAKEQSKQSGVEIDAEQVAAGMNDALGDSESRYSSEEVAAISAEFQAKMQAKMQEQMQEQQAAAAAAKSTNKTFLEKNAEKEGVVQTDSGLQYVELVKGEGPIPSASDTVKVHYKGTLLDGTQFDSSYERGQPATFPVGGVIPGWTEALTLMNVGDKWKLTIPSELAYGERGAGGQIPPNSVLEFEVELLGIESSEPSEDGAQSAPAESSDAETAE